MAARSDTVSQQEMDSTPQGVSIAISSLIVERGGTRVLQSIDIGVQTYTNY
ncbi:hypothetical protein BH20ACT22_BH20ACT22_01480 [soil metagenome]